MDSKTKNRLRGLISRVLSYESRQILIELHQHKPIQHNFTARYTINPEEIKEEIKDIFEGNQLTFPTPESIQMYAIKYLRQQEKIADPKLNPSFRILRERLEAGQYDILSSIGLPEYGQREKTS